MLHIILVFGSDHKQCSVILLSLLRYPESGTVQINVKDLRPRARTTLKWNELNIGDVVMVNYNVESPSNRGFWFDAEITALKTISRTKKELRVNIFLG